MRVLHTVCYRTGAARSSPAGRAYICVYIYIYIHTYHMIILLLLTIMIIVMAIGIIIISSSSSIQDPDSAERPDAASSSRLGAGYPKP